MTDRIVPEVGIHRDVDFEEYLNWDAINQSSLKIALKSPKKYKFGKAIEPTDAMRLGTLVHATQLEPTKIHERYAVLPPFENGYYDGEEWIEEPCTKANGEPSSKPKQTGMYQQRVDAWWKERGGVELVDRDWLDTADGMVRAMAEDKQCRDCLVEGEKEVSIVWEYEGFLCKARIDNWQQERRRICDLKSTADIFGFAWSLKKWGYHIQAAFYADGIKALTGEETEFWIAACEKEMPYECGAAPVDSKAVRLGRIQYREALETIRKCEESGDWPGFESPAKWELAHDVTILNVNGEEIAL